MKNIMLGCLLLHCSLLITIKSFTESEGNPTNSIAVNREINIDSTALPECIKKLSRPGSNGVRSFNGGQQYTHIHLLQNGKTLYAFRNEASIGCNRNEPAGTKYYDDSCRLAAYFPGKFSITQGFKPFIATGYLPSDFKESSQGDYPLYFSKQQTSTATSPKKEETVKDNYATEKWFVLGKEITPLLGFKTGDVIKVHTATGLWHYRNKKLLNQYKMVPQLTIITQKIVCARAPCPPIVTKKLVYFIGAAERFIDVSFNSLLISESKQKDAATPAAALETNWTRAFELRSQSSK